jgi:hypothetical protein
MSHPLMYVLGDTEEKDFPLVLTIGREPNYDDILTDDIGKIDISEFSSMSGGVWVTAYTQFAKQYVGEKGTSGFLKNLCFEKNASPIVFTNAFPMGIPQEVSDKTGIREKLINLIPDHISNLFSKEIIKRVKLVIHHGEEATEASSLAARLIQEKCRSTGIPYCSSAFFYNGNSAKIQESLKEFRAEIQLVFTEFTENA